MYSPPFITFSVVPYNTSLTRSVRISVSTPDFHSGKMSSTLIQTTVADFAISDIK